MGEKIPRRKYLKSVGISTATLIGAVSSVQGRKTKSKGPERRNPIATRKINTARFGGIRDCKLLMYPDSEYRLAVTGKEDVTNQRRKENSNKKATERANVYKFVGTNFHNSNGKYTPQRASGKIIKVPNPREEPEGDSEHGSGSKSTGSSPTTEDQVSINSQEDSESGNDYSVPYEGYAWTKVKNTPEAWYQNNYAKLVQTVKWDAQDGEVTSDDWWYCASKNGGGWSHKGNGNAENNFDGDDAFCKSFADFEQNNHDEFTIQETVSHKMHPDGNAEWQATVSSTGRGDQEGIKIWFGYDYSYDKSC